MIGVGSRTGAGGDPVGSGGDPVGSGGDPVGSGVGIRWDLVWGSSGIWCGDPMGSSVGLRWDLVWDSGGHAPEMEDSNTSEKRVRL